MKEHKVKQILFNRLCTFDDNLNDLSYQIIETEDGIVSNAIDYFFKPVNQLIYPSKSYAVAIVYSHLLEKYFQDNFFDSLNDVTLFCDNDKFFIPYSQSPKIYDQILEKISYSSVFELNLDLPQIAKTVKYFNQEFF